MQFLTHVIPEAIISSSFMQVGTTEANIAVVAEFEIKTTARSNFYRASTNDLALAQREAEEAGAIRLKLPNDEIYGAPPDNDPPGSPWAKESVAKDTRDI